MYCPTCGAELYPHDDACGSCGHREASRAAVSPGVVSTEASVSLPSYDEITASPIDLPIIDLLREAWGRAPLGTLVLNICVLLFLVSIASVLPLSFLLVPPLAAGMQILVLRALRGDPVCLKHAFAGFKQFLPLLGVFLIQGFAAIVGAILPTGLAAHWAFGLGQQVPKSPLPFVDLFGLFSNFFTVVLPSFVLFVLFAYFCAMFGSWSTWLVLDREESVLTALGASVRVVRAHLVPMLQLWLALFALNAVGVLAIGIGALLTVPLSFVVLGCAYERFFGIAGGATRLSA